MDNQPETKDNPPPEQPSADEKMEALEASMRALHATLNMRWQDAARLLDEAEAAAKALDSEDGDLVRGITGILTGMIESITHEARDTDPERYARSLKCLEAAIGQSQDFTRRFPAETANPDFESTFLMLEAMAIMTRQRLAKEQKDQRQLLILDGQLKDLFQRVPDSHQAGIQGIVAILSYQDNMARVLEGFSALDNMDLSRALQIISGVLKEIGPLVTAIEEDARGEVLFQSGYKGLLGMYRWVQAMEWYVRALHDAVVGDVTRKHVDQLQRAEEYIRSSTKEMTDGMIVLKQLNKQETQNYASTLESPIRRIRNLRALCLESLKPKRWFATASVKFVVVFLVTTVILLVGVEFTNAGGILGGRGVVTSYVLFVSFVAGLVGGFGFDSLRFLPFARLLSKSRGKIPESNENGSEPRTERLHHVE